MLAGSRNDSKAEAALLVEEAARLRL